MRRSRFTYYFLGLAALGACDRVEPPTTPLASPAQPALGKNTDPLTRASFKFRNETGQSARRLVVVFSGIVIDVPYASRGSPTVSNKTVTLSAFIAAPLDSVMLSVIVEGRSGKIESWYWADANGAVLGTTKTSCSARQSCESIPTPYGFTISSPLTTIAPLQAIAYCYYFRTPNAQSLAVRTWRSTLGAGVKRMNVILSGSDVQPATTQSPTNCAPFGFTQLPRRSWAFTAYRSGDELTFPSDDGSGRPVGLILPPTQSGYLYIEYENFTADPIESNVVVDVVPYDRGTAITSAGSYATFNASLYIPAGSTADSETQSCDVPPGAKFFYVSTYANKQMIQASIRDGSTTVFQSTDPYNPGSRSWSAPFLTFATGVLTNEFIYANPSNRTITTGSGFATDEHAVALTYYFPAAQSGFCIDGFEQF